MPRPAELISTYLDGPALLRRTLSGMSAEQLRARPIAGQWSTHEVVCHLVDSEQAYCHRMKRVIAEPKPLLVGYDETRFAETLAYHIRDIEEELLLLDAMRKQMAVILRNVPDSAWWLTGIHTERGLMTLEELLQTEADHIPHHVAFIAQKRRTLGLPDAS